MQDLRSVVRGMRARPGMYFGRAEAYRLDVVEAFLLGRSSVSNELVGFREFLVLRLGDGNNLGPAGVARHLALPGYRGGAITEEQEAVVLEVYLDLLDEFLAEVGSSDNRMRIIREHACWLEAKGWRLDGPHTGDPTVEEAADELGLSGRELFDLIADRKLGTSRQGADVYLHRRDVDALVAERGEA